MSFDVTRDPLQSGFLAIEASAGTGKTWTLSHLVARLLLTEPELDLGKILVVTFTNASADELAARVRRVLGECRAAAAGRSGATSAAQALVAAGEAACGGPAGVIARLDGCLGALDELAVGTIHAFCKQVLESAAFDCGEAFAAELAPDDSDLIADAVRDAWRTQLWGDPRMARFASSWTIEGDVKLWQRWNRRPGTRIEPAVTIADALEAASAAEAAVRSATTPQALALLRSWQWMKDHDPAEDLALLAAGGDLSGLQILIGDLTKTVFKKHLTAALAHPLLTACRRLTETAYQVRIAWLGWLCPAVAERLRTNQAVAGVWTQDDLLRRVRDALERRPQLAETVRKRWPIALIDEFQDTDPVQWEVFRRCHAEGGGRLVVVGDPKQAVYRFRGADLAAYLAAVASVQTERLTSNWRSDPALVAAVQTLIGRTSLPFLTPRIELTPVEGMTAAPPIDDEDAALTVLHPQDESTPPRRQDAVASEIVRLLGHHVGEKVIQPRDCAVLVRTGSQAREMREALLRRGVPATMAVHGDVLDSPAAAELHAVLAALARPRDGQALRLALATRAWGRDAAAIATAVADDQAWQILVEQVEAHHQRWLRFGLTAAIDGWAAEVGALARFAALPDGERWLTDWRHAIEMLHGEASANGLRPAALLAWWMRRGGEGAEARRLRLEGDASAVRILTMHKAKGLEFPIVFCPFIGQSSESDDAGALVSDAAGTRLVFAGPGLDAAEAAVTAEDDAEQLRLAYVALTRARVRTYVLWGMWDRRKRQFHFPLQSALGWWLRPEGQSHADWRAATDSHVGGREPLLRDTSGRLGELRDAGAAISLRPAMVNWDRWQAQDPLVGGDGLRRLPPAVRAGLDRPRCVTSFTGLIGGEAAPEQRRDDEPQLPPPIATAPPSGLRAIARGADLGDALHTALEDWDFATDPSSRVRDALRPLGLEGSGPRQPHVDDAVAIVAAGLTALAALPIRCGDRELVLGAIPDRLRRAEWEFHLPLAQVRPERVLELIARHGELPREATRGLRLRDAAPGGGFLKGFVDLLASDGTAWWVLDWKSNHLGDAPEDYAADRLWPAMAGHHYLAQALIYVLALHRQLRHRLGANYHYDTHVAGAAWIFLRGVDSGQGVWTWKPPEALVLALERELLGDPP